MMVFAKEDESKQVEVKCSALRLMIQMLISFSSKPNDALSLFLNDKSFKSTIFSIATSSKDSII